MLVKDKDLRSIAAELLAFALLDLFPSAKLINTYLTDLGFGIDFTLGKSFDPSLFSMIDERMRILSKTDLIAEPVDMMRENAAQLFSHRGQPYLCEKIRALPSNILSLIRIGQHFGLNPVTTRNPVSALKSLKLLRYTYQEKAQTATEILHPVSIEGILSHDSKSLKKFMKVWAEVKENSYQSLGSRLNLFFQCEGVLSGALTWLPKGERYKEVLIAWWKEIHQSEGFAPISTPAWYYTPPAQVKPSGTTSFFDKDGHEIVYLSDPSAGVDELFVSHFHAHEDPLRFYEISQRINPWTERKNLGVFQEEIFLKDHAFCFVKEEEALKELISSLQFIEKYIKIFRIDYQWYLVSDKPKISGNQGQVDLLLNALNILGIECIQVQKENPQDNTRLEIRYFDSLGREWRGAGIEMQPFPRKESSKVPGKAGLIQRRLLITRTLFGSLERFALMLLERHAGHLPLWLAPEQVRVIPVNGSIITYARKVCSALLREGIRAELDSASDLLAAKVFTVKAAKIPYAVVVGEVEQRNGTITVCPYEDSGKGETEVIEAFISKLKNEIESKLNPVPNEKN